MNAIHRRGADATTTSPLAHRNETGASSTATTLRPLSLPDGAIHFDNLPDAALVDIETFARITGSGVSTTWRRLKADPTFPRPTRLGTRCTRFRVGDIRAWLASKAEATAPAVTPQRRPKRAAA